jgi:hypothetical protein
MVLPEPGIVIMGGSSRQVYHLVDAQRRVSFMNVA